MGLWHFAVFWMCALVILWFSPRMLSITIRKIIDRKKLNRYLTICWIFFWFSFLVFVANLYLGASNEASSIQRGLLIALLFIFCLYALPVLYRRRKDLHAIVLYEDLRAGKKEKPLILLLRPFEFDGKITRVIHTKDELPPSLGPAITEINLEDFLVSYADQYGDVVSLGNSVKVGEHLAAAARFECKNREWKETVSEFLTNADVIILLPSLKSGTRWEMDEILRLGLLDRTLIVNWPAESNLVRNTAPYDLNWNAIQSYFAKNARKLPNQTRNGAIYLFSGANESPFSFEPLMPSTMKTIHPSKNAALSQAIVEVLDSAQLRSLQTCASTNVWQDCD